MKKRHFYPSELNRIMDALKEHQFRINITNKGTFIIIPPESYKDIPCYSSHFSHRAYHPLRRYLRTNFGIIL